jgi:hypothetical protein
MRRLQALQGREVADRALHGGEFGPQSRQRLGMGVEHLAADFGAARAEVGSGRPDLLAHPLRRPAIDGDRRTNDARQFAGMERFQRVQFDRAFAEPLFKPFLLGSESLIGMRGRR